MVVDDGGALVDEFCAGRVSGRVVVCDSRNEPGIGCPGRNCRMSKGCAVDDDESEILPQWIMPNQI